MKKFYPFSLPFIACLLLLCSFAQAQPPCVTNTIPANGSVFSIATTSTQLSWTPAADAVSYDVYIWYGPYPALTPIANVRTNSFTATDLAVSSVYHWYIVPRNAAGAATGCSSNQTSFTTSAISAAGTGLRGNYYNNTTLTGTPVLSRIDPSINFAFTYSTVLSPAPGIVPDDKYSVSWTGQVEALFSEPYTFYTLSDDGIRLWVNGVKLVDNWVNQGATEKSGKINLIAGQKYNIRIDYYENTGEAITKLSWSSPSTQKKVIPTAMLYPTGYTEQPAAPQCVNNNYPVDLTRLTTATTAGLEWPVAATATSYDVYLWVGGVPATTPIANVSSNYYAATGLIPGAQYSWYVSPKNGVCAATGCVANTTRFFTAFEETPPPPCTRNQAPADGAILPTQTSAQFIWASNPDYSYNIYLWTGDTVPKQPINSGAVSTGLTLNNLLPGTTYHWYIETVYKGSINKTCASTTTSFTTAPAVLPVPACVTVSSPASGSTIPDQTSTTLSWQAVTYAANYDLYLWTGNTAPASPTVSSTATTYVASNLVAGTTYKWYVVPKNASGAAANCGAQVSTFTTAAVTTGNGTGLLGNYYNGIDLSGQLLLSRVDPTINFSLQYNTTLSPAPGVVPDNNFSVRWTGQVQAAHTQVYTFYTESDDGIRLWVNGSKLVDNWTSHGPTKNSGTISLVAGQKYDIVIEYYQAGGEGAAILLWSDGLNAGKTVVPQSLLYPPANTPPTAPPTCAANVSPAKNSTIPTADQALLSWNSIPAASSYDVYLWKANDPIPTIPVANVSGSMYTAVNLTASTVYSWYVVPKNSIGAPDYCFSATTNFTTGVPTLACATNLIPANNSVAPALGNDVTSTQLIWNNVLNADRYSIYLWKTGDPIPTTAYAFATMTNKTFATGLHPNTRYTWYVTPGNSANVANGCIADSTSFTTGTPSARVANAGALKTAGLTVESLLSASLSPNPVQQGQLARLQISSDKTSTATLNIINSSGAVVHTSKLNLFPGNNTTDVHTFSMAQGLYIITLTGGNKPVQLKMIVK